MHHQRAQRGRCHITDNATSPRRTTASLRRDTAQVLEISARPPSPQRPCRTRRERTIRIVNPAISSNCPIKGVQYLFSASMGVSRPHSETPQYSPSNQIPAGGDFQALGSTTGDGGFRRLRLRSKNPAMSSISRKATEAWGCPCRWNTCLTYTSR